VAPDDRIAAGIAAIEDRLSLLTRQVFGVNCYSVRHIQLASQLITVAADEFL
jgi:hypothetical protein